MVETIIGIALIVMAVFLVIAVLMQSSKDHRMGASIAGGAETFFGKQKGKSMDALFNKLTTVIAIIFVLLVLVLYVIQPDVDYNTMLNDAMQAQQDELVNGDDNAENNEDNAEGEAGITADDTSADDTSADDTSADDTNADGDAIDGADDDTNGDIAE